MDLLNIQNVKNSRDKSKNLKLDLWKVVANAIGINSQQQKVNLMIDFQNDWSNPVLQDVLQSIESGQLTNSSTVQDLNSILQYSQLSSAVP